MFVGREQELKKLENAYKSSKGELFVIYGRRRIGKSMLVSHFGKDKHDFIKFEALENENTAAQIRHFSKTLAKYTKDPLLDSINFNKWDNVFTFITERLILHRKSDHKLTLFFDEVQWMASGRSELISIIKYYWDNHWKDNNVMLILCGSIASFMVRKIIKSKALYGRITGEILLKGLLPNEAALILRDKRSPAEILKYMLIFGGVPKYLEMINRSISFNLNINELCFSKDSILAKEMNKIFYSQFREPALYKRIAMLLNENNRSFGEIGKVLKVHSGGGLKSYLQNLEDAEIIKSYVPFDRDDSTKFRKYTLSDEYMIFYFKYVAPNLRIINESTSHQIFERLVKNSFDLWLGFAFERFCIKHAGYIAEKLGFGNEMLNAAPYFGREDNKFQIDLLFRRSDNIITLCEVKHYNREIETSIIPEVERKCKLIKIPRNYTLEKAIISLYGPDKSLLESGYFNYSLTLNDILRK
ncbi:AAA family ATPase [Candidatus Desantisbacteria bacterium]|nr:AAA family ATPase [Candidatus Desantisbacteria bacterium]